MSTVRAGALRPLIASSERIRLSGNEMANRLDMRTTSAWQNTAWTGYDTIGEVHFAFNLVGQVSSRAKLFSAIIVDPDQPPVSSKDYITMLDEQGLNAPIVREAMSIGQDVVAELAARARGGIAALIQSCAMNFSIPGELYLIAHKGQWITCSTDELDRNGDRLIYRKHRASGGSSSSMSRNAQGRDELLDKDAFAARIWRPHPRWHTEPDSSMLGTLDAVEAMMLYQQAFRTILRSQMNAGMLFIPDGIASATGEGEPESFEDTLARVIMGTVSDETVKETVVPVIGRGAPDLGEKIKHIPFGRKIDQEFILGMQETLDRVLNGLDIPKDVAKSLSEIKYSNAIVVDDNLFKAHIYPLILLIVDSLSQVYYRPMVKQRLYANPVTRSHASKLDLLLSRMCMWADTSDIVTRPDKSAAADAGYEKKIISASAWRDARGFGDADKPSEDEILFRLAMDKAQVSPEIADVLIQHLAPGFFKQARAAASTLPTELDSLLTGDPAADDPVEVGQDEGGEINPNGTLPPVPEM